MKKQLSPGIVVLIIAVAVIIIGMIFWRGTSSNTKKAVEMENMLRNRNKSAMKIPPPPSNAPNQAPR